MATGDFGNGLIELMIWVVVIISLLITGMVWKSWVFIVLLGVIVGFLRRINLF